MIVIPHEAIELQKGETIHAACDRIRATTVTRAKGGYLSTLSV